MSERRDSVPFDPRFFEGLPDQGAPASIQETFERIYRTDHWKGGESVSGRGAARRQLRQLTMQLPTLLKTLEVAVLLDVPCGDFSPFRDLDLPVSRYLGGDIVPDLIRLNQLRYGSESVQFLELDLTTGPLPPADLLLCRDCLVHLSFADIFRALGVIRKSSIRHLLTTTFTDCRENEDITTGDWRLLNLEKPPFNFPAPLELLNEGCTEARGLYRDKCLGLWRVEDLAGQWDALPGRHA